jgi:hypothetical protein
VIDFPASPTIGQQFTAAGVTWIWDGAKWLPSGLSPTVVPGINANRIINGDMRIDQRNGGASGTALGVYTVDRWLYAANQTAKGTWGRAGSTVSGFAYSLGFTSSSAYASLAADYFEFYQPIEADMVTDFAWGTANAQPVTLSFWVWSSLTGTFGGVVKNYVTTTRSYPFTYSVPVASTWTRIVLTIPGDTVGTWVMSSAAGSMYVMFDLGSGSTYRGPANAWASANYIGATGAVSIVAVNGATFYVTGVKLEIGNVATSFNRYSLAKSLADCQRYFYKPANSIYGSGYAPTAGALSCFASRAFQTAMRAAPTQSGATFSNVNLNTPATQSLSPDGVTWTATNAAAGVFQLGIVANTETYSAEL